MHLVHLDLMAKRETLLKCQGKVHIALWWLKLGIAYYTIQFK